MKRLLALLLLIAAVSVLILPTTVLGHASLVSSDPGDNAFLEKAPPQLTLVFAESVDPNSTAVHLVDGNGSELALGPLQFSQDGLTVTASLPALSPGIYNVLWQNVSKTDGHAIAGSFPFTILNPDGSLPSTVNHVQGIGTNTDPSPLADSVAVRALSLFGLAIAAGGALLVLLWGEAGASIRRGLERVVYFGAALVGVATLLNLQTIRSVYTNESLFHVVTQTTNGGYWLTRMGAVCLLAIVATFLPEAPKRTSTALLAILGVYVWGYTSTSHAAASGGNAWARGVDMVHGVAALLWIGAVIGVAVSARLLQRKGEYARLMPRFSLLASVLVFALLASGLFSALVEIDHPDKLINTKYGITLLVKLGLIVPLLVAAAYNARIGRRRLIALAPGEPRRFIATASLEIVLGIAVFGAAAVMTQSTVAKSIVEPVASKPFDQTAVANDLLVVLKIDPNRTGLNTYRVTLTDKQGGLVGAQRVRLLFSYLDNQNVGPSSLILGDSGPGTFQGRGPFFTLEGQWRVQVEVRRAGVDDASAFFDVRPGGTQVGTLRRGGAWSNPTPSLGWNELGGLGLLILGFAFALWRQEIGRLGRAFGWAANGATMAGFAFGILLLFGVHSDIAPGAIPVNPIFPDQSSIATGRALYEQNCVSCHGLKGVPPSGLHLNPYPLDLTVHVPAHPDGVLYNFIAHGIPGSSMPAWGDNGTLTPEQIWHVVNFLRTLGAVNQ